MEENWDFLRRILVLKFGIWGRREQRKVEARRQRGSVPRGVSTSGSALWWVGQGAWGRASLGLRRVMD